MKLYKNAVILAAVLVLLVGAYFIVKGIAGKTSSNTPATPDTIKLIDVEQDKIDTLTVVNNNETFIIKKAKTDFTLVSPTGFKWSKDNVSTVMANAYFVSADKLVEKESKDFSKYGLDKPLATVTLKMKDGKVHELRIGDKTSTGDGYYGAVKGSKSVYIIGSYTVEKLLVTRMMLRDTVLFSFKPDDVTSIDMERYGKPLFSAAKNTDGNWEMTYPIQGNADSSSIGTMTTAFAQADVSEYVEENVKDLGKYGLANPVYAIEMGTKKVKNKILFGKEKEQGSTIYAMLAGDSTNTVFTLSEAAQSTDSAGQTTTPAGFSFLDKPLKEIVDVFAYLVNIKDVNKLVVEMDGRTVTSDIVTDKDDSDKDKFTVNGKDATMRDEDDNQPFRGYYQALIGVTLSDIEIADIPEGKPAITFTYYLKKAPKVMKVEFVPKNENYYYVFRNGKYSNIIVSKDLFYGKDGVSEMYKKLQDVMSKAKK